MMHGPPGTPRSIANAQATDPASMQRHFGGATDLLPLWIAEPYVDTAPEIAVALEERAGVGWYGYETRRPSVEEAFWSWMHRRHGWRGSESTTLVSPSVGTSIGVLIDQHTDPGSGVILMPPVFTDFRPLIRAAGRQVIRNPLVLTPNGYRLDLDDLATKAADPMAQAIILCSPHNPVGRVWTHAELEAVAAIAGRYDLLVIADEIHADLVLPPHVFTPFAPIAGAAGVRSAAIHGPIKTFGLAGICDTLLITTDEIIATAFAAKSSQLHLTRNNVFGLAAMTAAYRLGDRWVDDLLALTASNVAHLRDALPQPVRLVETEGTYLAWLDFRGLGLAVPELAEWLWSSARLAVSPGHWFGREGAGFARMTIAVPRETMVEATERLRRAVRTA